ncbi:MAG: endonuclease/exonuclease/phosphatase family protein [Cytophagales bacterium]|nr:endonuclease/exonuclease/phosphatase family protein [Bernardetiaceae bacterium]MDW8210377.1 endonuclease/exonuclease/phosphatase family protein [Cytophagales bacterium]
MAVGLWLLHKMSLLIFVVSLLCYVAPTIKPDFFPFAGFLAMCIPLCMIAHLGMFLAWLMVKKFQPAVLSLLGLLMAFPYWNATVAFRLSSEQKPDFEVLSYNVRLFNAYDRPEHSPQAKAIIQWVIEDSSHIKCLQEYYQLDTSTLFNLPTKMSSKLRKYYHFFSPCCMNNLGGQMGLAIYSCFPIVNQGTIDLKGRFPYGAIFADIVIGKDTIRVYNLHLQSMSINEHALFQSSSNWEKIKAIVKDVLKRLKYGFRQRSQQVEIIAKHVSVSPYPVVLCGDLNDLPYSYTYYRFSQLLRNAFEDAAMGLGFTYNGKFLSFLRIDNQFYSQGLQPTYLHTIRQANYSDHFPLKAGYRLLVH